MSTVQRNPLTAGAESPTKPRKVSSRPAESADEHQSLIDLVRDHRRCDQQYCNSGGSRDLQNEEPKRPHARVMVDACYLCIIINCGGSYKKIVFLLCISNRRDQRQSGPLVQEGGGEVRVLQHKKGVKNRQACRYNRGAGEIETRRTNRDLGGKSRPVLSLVYGVVYMKCVREREIELRTCYCSVVRGGMTLSSWRRCGCTPNPFLDNVYCFLRWLCWDTKPTKGSDRISASGL